jgi:hypothetical protein
MHKCSDINTVADEFRRQMTGDIKSMVDTVARCREVVEGEIRKKVEFNIKVKEIEREICDHVDKLKQLMDREKSDLLEELESFTVERNKQMNNVIEEIEQQISFIESLRTYTEQLKDQGRSGDVTQQRSTLQDRADELMKLDAIGLQRASDEMGSVVVTFTAATWPTSVGDMVGKISKKHNAGDNVLLHNFCCVLFVFHDVNIVLLNSNTPLVIRHKHIIIDTCFYIELARVYAEDHVQKTNCVTYC